MSQWYAIRSATRQEKRAEASLRELGFEVYLPRETRWHRSGRRRVALETPLFVGYLFVALEAPEPFSVVREADGVHNLVGIRGTPQPIADKFIEVFNAAEARGEFDRTLGVAHGPYRPGQEVAIVKGKFTDWPATVVRMTGPERVELLVRAFGWNHVKTLHVDDLRAA